MKKFKKGDKVFIAEDLGPSMKHFTSGVEAIVIGTYADQYGGKDNNSYTLYIYGEGECSWYYENQLTLVKSDCKDELKKWKEELKNKDKVESNLDWIFENGASVVKSASGSSVQKLFNCLFKGSLWGSNGEGINYYHNYYTVMSLAEPYLQTGDKEGWLRFCEEVKK